MRSVEASTSNATHLAAPKTTAPEIISRREMLRRIGRSVAVATVLPPLLEAVIPTGEKCVSTADMPSPAPQETKNLHTTTPVQNLEPSLLMDTMKQSLIYTAAQIAVFPLVGKVTKLPLGKSISPETRDRLRKNPLGTLIRGFEAPIMEEAVYRQIPSLIVDLTTNNAKGDFWQVGVPMAAIFAARHNLKLETMQFNIEKIPLPQFVGGLFYWYLMRERGFAHASLAHITHNTIINILGISFSRLEKATKESTGTEEKSDQNN